MTEMSDYYVSVSGIICITVKVRGLNKPTEPRLFKVIGFDSLGLLKHKEIR